MSLPARFVVDGVPDPRAGVIVDFSEWMHKAFHAGIDRVASIVVGKLAALLSPPLPAWVVVAVDAPTRAGRRYELTSHLDPDARYKAGRTVKPAEFWTIYDALLDFVAAHRIPILGPDYGVEQTWEADDSAATATRIAREHGLLVALYSNDKDWAQLVRDDHPAVVLWDGAGRVRDRAAIDRAPTGKAAPGEGGEAFGVRAEQLADWLAIVGDTSDNVAGVRGLGPVAATSLLATYGTLDEILGATVYTAEQRGGLKRAAVGCARQASKLLKDRRADDAAVLRRDADDARAKLSLDGYVAKVHEHRDAALLARELVRLDDSVPIRLDLDAIPLGGFDVAEIARMLRDAWGFTALANEVRGVGPKRALPITAKEAA